MALCVEVDEAEAWGKYKIPMHLALSNRNWSLVLTYQALCYNSDAGDSPSNENNNTTAHKQKEDIKHSLQFYQLSIIELICSLKMWKRKSPRSIISFQYIETA